MTTRTQCTATTQKGWQCKRSAQPGKLYCKQHRVNRQIPSSTKQPRHISEDPKSHTSQAQEKEYRRKVELNKKLENQGYWHIPYYDADDPQQTEEPSLMWILPQEPDWSQKSTYPNQQLFLSGKQVTIDLPYGGVNAYQYFPIQFTGPISVRQFVSKVNRAYKSWMRSHGLKVIDQVFPPPPDVIDDGSTNFVVDGLVCVGDGHYQMYIRYD